MALGQVFASGQLFFFYRRVFTVNLCEEWFVCYISNSSNKNNLLTHCCSSHSRSLTFGISRRRLDGAGAGEHGLAYFESKNKIKNKSKKLVPKTKQNKILLSQEESEPILWQKLHEKNTVFVKHFQKTKLKSKTYNLLFWKLYFFFKHLRGFVTILLTAWFLQNIKFFLDYKKIFLKYSRLQQKIFSTLSFKLSYAKTRLLWPTYFLTTDNFYLEIFVPINKEVLISNAPEKVLQRQIR